MVAKLQLFGRMGIIHFPEMSTIIAVDDSLQVAVPLQYISASCRY